MSITINRTVDIIAAEILSIKEQTVRQVLSNSIEIGRRLVEAKEIVPQGEWGNWLENTVDFKKSTANNLMRIFQEYASDQLSLIGDNVKSQTLGKLSYSQAITLLAVPSEERESFILENNVENLSSRELQKKVDEVKKLKKELLDQKEKTKKVSAQKDETVQINIALQKKYEEDINKIRIDLEAKKNEISELEKRPIDVNTADKDELDKLKAEKEELEIKLKEVPTPAQDDSIVRYSVYFNSVQEEFTKLLEELEKIPEEDAETFRGATKQILSMMLERL